MKKALAAALLAVSLITSPASAYSKGGGKSDQARGQDRAVENCDAHVLDQNGSNVRARGGPKKPSEEDSQAPMNCDHFWQQDD